MRTPTCGFAWLLPALAAGLCASAAAPDLPRIDAATTLLVVSPHPDDETLCCAGVIGRVLHAGGRASVVWITSGDASRLTLMLSERSVFSNPAQARQLGQRRMAEARAAATLLGVPASGQLFLGYPDGGLSALLAEHGPIAYASPFTAAAAVPYPGALFPGHPYSGDSLARDFAAVLDELRPTLILAPSPLDSHPDHRATGLLTIAVTTRRGTLGEVHYWIVHGGEGWPSPRGLIEGIPLTPAPLGRSLACVPFSLAPAEEDLKLQALRAYDTQMQVMAPFLLAFVRTTEVFCQGAAGELPPAP
jgi:LmbE family N-acetylglucosaminyl deacetylase